MASKLQKQWDYYMSKEEEFLKNCYGKYLVINDKLDAVVMDTIGDAYKLGCLAFGLGNFLIQECVEQKPIYLRNVFRPELKGKRYVKTEGGFCLVNVEKEEGNVWDDSL